MGACINTTKGMHLLGKTLLVTGGASGLGRATVLRLIKSGANAVVLDVKEDCALQLVSELGEKQLLWPGKTDITDEYSVQSAIDQAASRFGGLHGAINCAGIAIAAKLIGKKGIHPLDKFNAVQKVNVCGTFNVDRLAVSQMVKQEPDENGERGVLVHTASVAAFDGQNGQIAYSASKGAIVGMTLPMARELGEFGIRVVTVAPGVMDTPMLAGLPEKARQILFKDTVFPHRLGKPQEYSKLVCHILENSYLNGEVIRLDAALRMPKM